MRVQRCDGFSLMEVLVTVVVVAIALLGMAGLQFTGLKASSEAHEYTLASQLAQDIMERIQANSDARDSYYPVELDPDSALAAPKDCTVSGCAPQEMAAYDLWQWYDLLSRGAPLLPQGKLAISAVPGVAGTRVFTATIFWGQGDDNSKKRYAFTFEI